MTYPRAQSLRDALETVRWKYSAPMLRNFLAKTAPPASMSGGSRALYNVGRFGAPPLAIYGAADAMGWTGRHSLLDYTGLRSTLAPPSAPNPSEGPSFGESAFDYPAEAPQTWAGYAPPR